MENIENEFLRKNKNIDEMNTKEQFLYYLGMYQNSVVGKESYGNETEFYDEDGCVLFTITYDESLNKMIFKFADSQELFEHIIINEEEFDKINNEFFGHVEDNKFDEYENDYMEYESYDYL